MASTIPLFQEQFNRLLRWHNEGWAPPMHLDLWLTDRCNLRCLFCPNSTVRAEDEGVIKAEISDERWLEVMHEGLSLGVQTWRIIGGGEPMVRGDLVISSAETIKSHPGPTNCEIHTNGTLFTKSGIQRIVESGLDNLTVSLDGSTSEVHDWLRGTPGAFKRTTEALRNFRDIKVELGKDCPQVQIKMVLCSKNVHQVEAMLRLAASLGVSVVDLDPLIDLDLGSGAFSALRLQPEHRESLFAQSVDIFQTARESGVKINRKLELLPGGDRDVTPCSELYLLEDLRKGHRHPISRPGPRCLEPWYVMVINPYGHVAPCSVARFPLNDYETDPSVTSSSLTAIWASDFMRELRQDVYNNQQLSMCTVCPKKHIRLVKDYFMVLSQRENSTWNPLRCASSRTG